LAIQAPAWFFRNTLDAGELGLGILGEHASGRDWIARKNCSVYPAVMAGETGEPQTIPGAGGHSTSATVRSPGRHGDNARRGAAVLLVLSFLN